MGPWARTLASMTAAGLLAVLLPPAGHGAALQDGSSAGLVVDVRLLTAVSSRAADGAEVRAVTITSPLDASPVVPPGCEFTGVSRQDRTRARQRQRTALRLAFGELRGRGVRQPVVARVLAADNLRESVDPDGVILGLEPLRAVPSRIETVLLLLAHAHPFLEVTAEGVRLTRRELARPGISLAAGTELRLVLDAPPASPIDCGQPVLPLQPAPADLQTAAGDWALRTSAGAPSRDADWINLAFAGPRETLTAGFEAAGWSRADPASVRSDARTLVALAEAHGYRAGPVSRLLLDGAPPALVFEKQNNTFAKRHHIRIWPGSVPWDGRPIWLAAATHDIAIEFSRGEGRFTHRIDPAIDGERAKVVGDLAAADRVAGLYLVARPAVPATSLNAAGDPVTTDGRIAVVALK